MNPFDAEDGIVVAPVGDTRDDNLRSRIFFDVNAFQARFIGLYDDKEVFAIGLIQSVVLRYGHGRLETLGAARLYPTSIEKMALRYLEFGPESDLEPWYFYIVKEFFPTSLKKSTKFGVPRTRVFSVRDLTGQDAMFEDAETLSAALKDITHPLGGRQQ
ncbi:hypothetical protein [Paracoccus marinus]|uniref:hypothetical protein n=1 Tax=Paracoccus marinus TaxID=288426 RepID=UPI00103E3060|nr:hypothetical protein [Paracoccus marinus]GLS80717.1 hypothetical protein GCM10007893_15060 [Paracoccus marinus]